jgi:hypothetical protein
MGITLLLAGMIVFVIAGVLNGGDPIDQLERDKEAKRIADLAINADMTVPFAVFLRPFSSTGNFRQKSRQLLPQEVTVGSSSPSREYSFELESMIAQVIHNWLPMIALGRPGEHFGSGRLPVSDDEWQEVVKSLVHQADVIFVVPDTSEGMLWELSHLRDEGYLPKCVMIMPPNPAADSWDAARDLLRPLGYRLPDHNVRGAMFRLTIEGEVEILRLLPRRWSMRRLRRILHSFREPPQQSTGEDARSAA